MRAYKTGASGNKNPFHNQVYISFSTCVILRKLFFSSKTNMMQRSKNWIHCSRNVMSLRTRNCSRQSSQATNLMMRSLHSLQTPTRLRRKPRPYRELIFEKVNNFITNFYLCLSSIRFNILAYLFCVFSLFLCSSSSIHPP